MNTTSFQISVAIDEDKVHAVSRLIESAADPLVRFCRAKRFDGMKHDDGKMRFDLFDANAREEEACVLTFGAIKYDPDNWREVEDAYNKYSAALERHLVERRRGHRFDHETTLLILAHVSICAHFLLGFELMADPTLNESRPERLKKALEVARELRAKRLAKDSGSGV